MDNDRFREILILSDSHGKESHIRALLRSHPNASMLLFCGDGVRDAERAVLDFPHILLLAVRGNCDFFGADDIPTERMIPIGGIRILMMHGHLFGVKGGLGSVVSYGFREDADILLFGHTHLPHEARFVKNEKQLVLFNPGSIGKRDNGAYSYGVLTVRENGWLLSHGTLDESI